MAAKTRLRVVPVCASVGLASLGLASLGLALLGVFPAVGFAADSASDASSSQQASRFPTAAQLRCSDASCTQGLLNEPMFVGLEYRDADIIGGGAFSTALGFVNKVSTFWTDVPNRQAVAGGVSLSLNIATFTSMKAARNAIRADGTSEGLRLISESDASLVALWQGELSAPDGTRLRYAYVLTDRPVPTVVRGVCALWGSSRRSPACSATNLMSVIRAGALHETTTTSTMAVAAENVPVGIVPVVTVSVDGSSGWAAESPGVGLLTALAGTTTTWTQYVHMDEPNMAITQRTVTLPEAADVSQFVDTPCEPPSPSTTCRSLALAGGGSLRMTSLKQAPTKIVQIQIRLFGSQRLTLVECTRPRDFTPMSPVEQAHCRRLAKQLADASIAD